MMDNYIELKLLAGDSIYVEGVGNLHQFTLREIKDMGEDLYNKYLFSVILDKSQLELDDSLIKDVSNFTIVMTYSIYDPSYMDSFIEALKFFFKEESVGFHPSGFFYLGEIIEMRKIDDSNFEYIQDLLRKMNWIKKPEGYNPANEKAKWIIDMIKQNRKNQPPKPVDMNIYSLTSGLAWKSNNTNIFSIWDLTLYQLYDGYYRLENIDHSNNVMRAIYSGTIDSKSMNLKDINWAKILKF